MITKLRTDIHTDLLYSRTGYGITSRLVMAKINVENAASDGFGWNFSRTVQARITKFRMLIEENWPNKCAAYNVTIAACGRLKNATKHCTKVHKPGPAGQRIEYSGLCLT